MRIAIGSDHRGVSLKAHLAELLAQWGHDVMDVGTDSEESVDYPDIASAVGNQVSQEQVDRGILICGTGIGMAITANKFSGVRAAPCGNTETAEVSRRHNDLNVLCLPANDLGSETQTDMLVRTWLDTPFDAGRHARRLEKITALEKPTASNGPGDSSSSS